MFVYINMSKVLFIQLIITYVHSADDEMTLAATRLLLSIMPVVDPSTFSDNSSDLFGRMYDLVKVGRYCS